MSQSKMLAEKAGEAANKYATQVYRYDTDIRHRYFQEYMTMEMAVVHPAYWKRGHGLELVKCDMGLSRAGIATQGVMAVDQGTDLYRKLGYRHLDDVRIEGDAQVPAGVMIAIMEYSRHGSSPEDEGRERPQDIQDFGASRYPQTTNFRK